ncbi:MAG TPA: ABC transporter [Candidatus Moranbacteria bacterium]|nr:ABC transporter [Candidatus Moranbacteria bacterium]HBT45458.1 ABC transporter [Candidatus Moranbacteria bacterium]
MKKPIIEVKKLCKTYEYVEKNPGIKHSLRNLFAREKKQKEAVKDVSFKIEEGELVGFLGPNGAGKTTTLKMLAGILTPTSGEVEVSGYEPIKRQKEYQMQFAFVMGQKMQLWWDLPPMESFLLNKKIYEVNDEDFEKNLSEMIELLDVGGIVNKQVRQLSLGERMKCELIAALLHSPKVLFLDEPTIGLDVVAQKKIRDFIKKYNQERKTTIILTSHYMEDIAQLCKRIVIIDMGKIIYDGSLEDLISKYVPNKKITIYFEKEVSREDVEQFGALVEFDFLKLVFEIPREKVKDVVGKILSSNLEVKDLEIDEEDIESIIRNIFTK